MQRLVRYRLAGVPAMPALCHCSMCRRASAAPMVAWAMYQQAQVSFTGAPPQSTNLRRAVLAVSARVAARRSASRLSTFQASLTSRSEVSTVRKRCHPPFTLGSRSGCSGCWSAMLCLVTPSSRLRSRLVPTMSANPSIERTFQRSLRAFLLAARVER